MAYPQRRACLLLRLHDLQGAGDHGAHVAQVGRHDQGVVGLGQLGKSVHIVLGHAQADRVHAARRVDRVAHLAQGRGAGFGQRHDGGGFALGAVDLGLLLAFRARNRRFPFTLAYSGKFLRRNINMHDFLLWINELEKQ